MTRFVLKATAAAVGAVLSSGAYAITLNGTVAANNYASELNYNGAVAPGIAITAPYDIDTTLGFGVSAGQNRYARVVLSPNASFAAAVATDSFYDATTAFSATTSGFGTDANVTDGVTIVSGGGVGNRCVVYQITGEAGAGNGASDVVHWEFPNINVNSTATPVTATYTLHETATSATCAGVTGSNTTGTDNAVLATPVTGNILAFASGLTFTTVPNTAVASVDKLYKTFKAATNVVTGPAPSVANDTAAIGTLTYGPSGALNETNVPATLAQLLTGANLIVTGTNGFAAAGANDWFIDNVAGGTCATSSIGGTLGAGSPPTTASLVVGLTTLTGVDVCFQADNVDQIPEQFSPGFTVALDVDEATRPARSSLADRAAITLGTVTHDGTVLKAPYMQLRNGQTTLVQLANMGTNDAPYTIRCFGTSVAVGTGTPGTVPAGKTKVIGTGGTGCPQSTTTAVEFTLAVPQGNVTASLVRANQTTGDSAIDGLVGNQ